MKSKLSPETLKEGDKVAIIATARKVEKQALEKAKEVLDSWGLQVIEGNNLNRVHHQFCGTDEERKADLQRALDDREIKAIICFRGGYGTVRILDGLDLSNFMHHPKWICGYSDVTALHNFINKQCNAVSIHSTMPINFETNTNEAIESLKNCLTGKQNVFEFPGDLRNRRGEVEAEVVGGNLSMLYSLSGTKYDLDMKGKILLLEDLDEYLYHIDRMMWNLKLSGKLEGLAGLIVGGMTDMNDNAVPFGKTAEEIIVEAVADYDFPLCFNFPIGHLDDNRAIKLNEKAKLVIGERVKFEQ